MKRLLFFLLFGVTVFAQSSLEKRSTDQLTINNPITYPNAFQIFNNQDLLVTITREGKVTFGSNYKPEEAARIFWQTIGSYAPDAPSPKPEWVPDPSAGHYDCPDGWTAFSRSEPMIEWNGPVAAAAIYIQTPKDKKGHVLGVQPNPPLCVRNSQ